MSAVLSAKMVFAAKAIMVTHLLLLADFVQTGPTDTVTCSSRQYPHPSDGICCNMCRPGEKVDQHCMYRPDDGVCVPCPDGFYQDGWSGATFCYQIDQCNKSHERIVVKAEADGTSDNQCACDPGYEYSGTGELCLKSTFPFEPTTRSQGPAYTGTSTQKTTQLPKQMPTKVPTVERTSFPPDDRSGSTTTEIVSTVRPPPKPTSHQQIINSLIVTLVIVVISAIVIFIIVMVCQCRRMCCFRDCRNAGREDIESDRGSGREEAIAMMTSHQENSSSAVELDSQPDEGCLTGTTTSRRESTTSDENNLNRSSSVESGVYGAEPAIDVSGATSNQDNGSVGMTEEDKNILRSLMADFVSDLPVKSVLDKMPKLFLMEDVNEITNPYINDSEQRRLFITKLMSKGPTAFQEFVTVLEVACSHLADALKKRKDS